MQEMLFTAVFSLHWSVMQIHINIVSPYLNTAPPESRASSFFDFAVMCAGTSQENFIGLSPNPAYRDSYHLAEKMGVSLLGPLLSARPSHNFTVLPFFKNVSLKCHIQYFYLIML